MKKKVELSLILACYNEGPTLLSSLQSIYMVLSELPYNWELICIDDKSRDDTLSTLNKFAKKHKKVSVFTHKNNLGRGGTVREGIQKSKGKIVGYIDVDLEVSAVYVPEFVRRIKAGADVAIATRIYKENITSLSRWLASRTYSLIVNTFLDLQLADTEAGYKFFNKGKIMPVLRKTKNNHWFFDTEILVHSHNKHLKIDQIPVLFLRRMDKQSTVRIIPDTVDYIKAIYQFKKGLNK